LTAFAIVSGHLTADEAAKVALVEVQSQIDLWGEVEDCELEVFGAFRMGLRKEQRGGSPGACVGRRGL